MTKHKTTPAKNPESRNQQLVNLAVKEAERRLKDGTASSQMIVELLKATSMKNQLEIERLKSDLKVANAKIKQMESETRSSEMYEKAIEAFKRYSGHINDDDEYYEDDY